MTMVCVSNVPGSENEPPSEVESFSLMLAALRLSCTLDGGTLLTVTPMVAWPLPPSLSVIVTEAV